MYAKYTVVLNELMKDERVSERLNEALSSYPIYTKKSQEQYIPSIVPNRSELNQKILNHYKYREIGFETVGRFLDELEIAMNEIMPYYNQLFFTLDQDYNILFNADYTRDIEITKAGEDQSDTTSTISNKTENTAHDESSVDSSNQDLSKHIQSQTPQSELDITAENIDSVSYADQVDWNKSNAQGTSSTSGESSSSTDHEGTGNVQANTTREENEHSLETVRGNYGMVSSQQLVAQFRKLIRNVERDIIMDDRIQELFMMIY